MWLYSLVGVSGSGEGGRLVMGAAGSHSVWGDSRSGRQRAYILQYYYEPEIRRPDHENPTQ